MKYNSTRDNKIKIDGSAAIVEGLAADGGLFVPSSLPAISLNEISALISKDYFERAAYIINKFIPELSIGVLENCCKNAYDKFDGDPAPLVKIDDGMFILELWHGPTFAFKDIALTLLPYLMTNSKELLKQKDNTLILVATSGDTGKAALEGFKDVKGTDIIVLYPSDGVSQMQKLQMMTTTGENVFVSAINGNFDDAQNAVKEVFNDSEIAKDLKSKNVTLSSANSINWGRLVPQITYYFSAYADLIDSNQIKLGDKINFAVPCGNFGNILAGYYAKHMGLPINKLICASNKNNVLTDFFNEGEYDAKREFFKTSSPSMDILVSSNLERLIYEVSGRDDDLTKSRMNELKKNGNYSISDTELKKLSEDFYAGFADEEEVKDALGNFFEEYGYIADTHTSVALSVYNRYIVEQDDNTPTVIVSTASPYKFTEDVLAAIGEKPCKDIFKNLSKLEDATALEIPKELSELQSLEKRFTTCVKKQDIKKLVTDYVAKK